MKTESRIKTLILYPAIDNYKIFIMLIVGLIFISDGIQKIVFLEVASLDRIKGFWTFAHEYTTDFTLKLLLIGLIIYGSRNRYIDFQLVNF
jgi:hypothetical protein